MFVASLQSVTATVVLKHTSRNLETCLWRKGFSSAHIAHVGSLSNMHYNSHRLVHAFTSPCSLFHTWSLEVSSQTVLTNIHLTALVHQHLQKHYAFSLQENFPSIFQSFCFFYCLHSESLFSSKKTPQQHRKKERSLRRSLRTARIRNCAFFTRGAHVSIRSTAPRSITQNNRADGIKRA